MCSAKSWGTRNVARKKKCWLHSQRCYHRVRLFVSWKHQIQMNSKVNINWDNSHSLHFNGGVICLLPHFSKFIAHSLAIITFLMLHSAPLSNHLYFVDTPWLSTSSPRARLISSAEKVIVNRNFSIKNKTERTKRVSEEATKQQRRLTAFDWFFLPFFL